MVVIAISLKWRRFAAIVILAFEGICRPGEPLGACRRDLLLPRDLVLESPEVVFLQIRSPKGRRRGIGSIQHVKIKNFLVAGFLDKVFGRDDLAAPLYPGTASSFRRRWDHVLSFVHVPAKLQLTPASLRPGGAVRAYREDEEIAKLMWRMRLRNIDTLQHYLQEVGAASIFRDLPAEGQKCISCASMLFTPFLEAT